MEAGVSRLNLLGPQLHQLLVQTGVGSRSVPAGDRLQRADDECGQPDGRSAKGEQRRRDDLSIATERILHFRDAPPAEGDARQLSPSETPLAAGPVFVSPVVLSLPSQRGRGDSEESRSLSESVRLYRVEKKEYECAALYPSRFAFPDTCL
jgi:hypothetical protein